MAACYMGHIDIVQLLLDQGADAGLLDKENRPAISLFILGCTGGDLVSDLDYLATLTLLLASMQDCEALLNAMDKSGCNVLFHLAFEGLPEACDLLIQKGADPEISCGPDGLYPVHAAASTGNKLAFDALLGHGASIDAIDNDGRTVLSLAAVGGRPEMVQYLLDKGLDELHRDNHGWIALHLATLENKPEVIRVLCRHNPSTITEIDREGRHPLILAAEEGALEATEALLEFNPPLNQASLSGFNPIRVACLISRKSIAELLISKGADPDLVDLDGRSSLFVTVLQKITPMAEFLLSHGASPDCKDLLGRTPLHVAAYLGQLELVDLLLKWGANVNAVDEARRTPLLTATWQGELSTCKLLLDYSAKPDISCKEGATALHVAAQLGREELVRLLLQYSADHSILDGSGRTSAGVAELAGFGNISALLLSHGGAHQTVISQTSTQNSSGIGTGTRFSLADGPYFPIDENHENDRLKGEHKLDDSDPIDHIITDDHQHHQTSAQQPPKFNTHSSSLSNYTLSSSASLGSNGVSAAMENSALFTQCLLERSQSQKRARESEFGVQNLSRSSCSEPQHTQNTGSLSPQTHLYRNRPRIVTNPRCRMRPSQDFRTS